MADQSEASTGRVLIQSARREKISKAVARLIVKRIADDRLAPGTRLAPEQEMAEQLGVGRPSLREGLRLLEAAGIVSIRPGAGGGPVVGDPDARDFGELLTMYLQVRRAEMSELFEATAALEGMMAANAARATAAGEPGADELRELAATEMEIVERADDAAFVEHGMGFHRVLKQIGPQNTILRLVVDSAAELFNQRAVIRTAGRSDRTHYRRTAREHVAIAAAIADGDCHHAHDLMADHMRWESDYICSVYPSIRGEIVDWR